MMSEGEGEEDDENQFDALIRNSEMMAPTTLPPNTTSNRLGGTFNQKKMFAEIDFLDDDDEPANPMATTGRRGAISPRRTDVD